MESPRVPSRHVCRLLGWYWLVETLLAQLPLSCPVLPLLQSGSGRAWSWLYGYSKVVYYYDLGTTVLRRRSTGPLVHSSTRPLVCWSTFPSLDLGLWHPSTSNLSLNGGGVFCTLPPCQTHPSPPEQGISRHQRANLQTIFSLQPSLGWLCYSRLNNSVQ